MVLNIIKREIENYKKLIVSSEYDETYKWEALKNFQDNWDVDAHDFKAMYDKSLQNNYTQNLWAHTHWFPKAVMLTFIEYDSNKVRNMFQNLFSEDDAIDKRIDYFVYECDQLREEVVVDNPTYKSHFHDGQRIVSLYLAFRYPEKYAIYKFTEFKKFMELVKVNSIPGTGEYYRFFKTVKTIYGLIEKDEQLIQLHESLLTSNCYKGKMLMLAQDFIFTTARRYL